MLFTVDEVDPTLDEMVQLAAFYQHFVREGRKVALLMAGLPHNISSLLNNKTVSFLRRSNRRALDRIPDGEVSAALVRTAQAGNRNVDAAALTAATESIGGFPFMLQLVGYYAWDENPRASTLDSADFARGIAIAQQEMTYRILDATFAELSPATFVSPQLCWKMKGTAASPISSSGWGVPLPSWRSTASGLSTPASLANAHAASWGSTSLTSATTCRRSSTTENCCSRIRLPNPAPYSASL